MEVWVLSDSLGVIGVYSSPDKITAAIPELKGATFIRGEETFKVAGTEYTVSFKVVE